MVLLLFLMKIKMYSHFPFHGKKNYPFKEISDLDVDFPDKTDDKFYLSKLNEILPKVVDANSSLILCFTLPELMY